MDRDRSSLDKLGVRVSARAGLAMRIAATRAMRSGADPAEAMREALRRMQPTVIDAMVAAHLRGRLRQAQTAAPHFRARGRLQLAGTAYDGALEFLRKRLRLDQQGLEELVATYTRPALAVIDDLDRLLTRRIERTLFESVKAGDDLRTGVKKLRKAFDAAGVLPGNAHAVETVYRTQTQIAYSAGRWNSLQDPAVQEVLWGFRYVTVGDDRVRPNHAVMHGVTLPKDDPFWNTNTPPNGWNCRCAAVEVFEEAQRVEPEPFEVDGVIYRPEADVGFQFNPGKVFGESYALRNAASRTRERLPLPV